MTERIADARAIDSAKAAVVAIEETERKLI
jgi:hypothetical protein